MVEVINSTLMSIFLMSLISPLISIVCVIFLSLTSLIIFPEQTLAVGITENHLTSCPTSPNCVVSQNG